MERAEEKRVGMTPFSCSLGQRRVAERGSIAGLRPEEILRDERAAKCRGGWLNERLQWLVAEGVGVRVIGERVLQWCQDVTVCPVLRTGATACVCGWQRMQLVGYGLQFNVRFCGE